MIVIVDYKAGNLTSVKRALDYLGVQAIISSDPDSVRGADRVIFPGVGHAASAMHNLTSTGLGKALLDVFKRGTPLLGICLGTQIILSRSEEGPTECLGLLPGECKKFVAPSSEFKIPHMGWNCVKRVKNHPLLEDVSDGAEFYFVHSYFPCVADDSSVYLTCTYTIPFTAALGCKNLFATQFHLEKSGELGLSILRRFTLWDGSAC